MNPFLLGWLLGGSSSDDGCGCGCFIFFGIIIFIMAFIGLFSESCRYTLLPALILFIVILLVIYLLIRLAIYEIYKLFKD